MASKIEACPQCGRKVRKMVLIVPSRLMVRLGLDTIHRICEDCHAKNEADFHASEANR